jgi:hypothetical protein
VTAPLNKAYWKANRITVKGVRLQGWSVRDVERLAAADTSKVEHVGERPVLVAPLSAGDDAVGLGPWPIRMSR